MLVDGAGATVVGSKQARGRPVIRLDRRVERGAALARTMLRSVFRELITRAPTLELGEPTVLVGNFIPGITKMSYRV